MLRHAALCLLVCCVAACGDDDKPAVDAGSDAAAPDGGDGGGFIPRRDSSVSTGDPVPDCDPTDPLACGAGQKCAWVFRIISDDTATVYTGCVDESAERERGVPCEQWARTYEAEGLDDPTYVDPCAEGLFCAPDPNVRDLFTCQPLCALPTDCDDTDVCVDTPISGSVFVPVCRPTDNCSGLEPTGCPSGESCYLRPNTLYDGALALCLSHSPLTMGGGAPGDPCLDQGVQYISACQPGAVCWGDPRLTPAQWEDSDIRCRAYCDPTESDGDAGAGDGVCGSGQCIWIGDPMLGLNLAGLSNPPGVCD